MISYEKFNNVGLSQTTELFTILLERLAYLQCLQLNLKIRLPYLYCQKGNQFKFTPFAESMGAMSVNYFVSLKIHTVLEKWHELADTPTMKENSPGLTNSSPEDQDVPSDDNFVII